MVAASSEAAQLYYLEGSSSSTRYLYALGGYMGGY